MKNYTTIFFTFCLMLTSHAQQKDTIYGKVKSIKEKVLFLSDLENPKLFEDDGDYGHAGLTNPKLNKQTFVDAWYNSPWVKYINYSKDNNSFGYATSEIWYNKQQDTLEYFNYKYDKSNNLIQITRYYDPEDYSIRNFNYDKNKNLKSTAYFISNNPNTYSYSESVYNDDNLLIQRRNFNEKGETYGQNFTYCENGKVKEIINYSPFNGLKTIHSTTKRDSIRQNKISRRFIYDKNGAVKETQFFESSFSDSLPILVSRVVNTYSNKHLTKKIVFDPSEKVIYSWTYSYNTKEQLVQKVYEHPKIPKLNSTYRFTYNKSGYIKKLEYLEHDKTFSVKFNYEFDQKNNWVKQVKIVNGKKLYVWIRDIEYYE